MLYSFLDKELLGGQPLVGCSTVFIQYDIKMDLTELECDGVDRIQLAYERV
jgi:hypothetical protein